MTGEFKNSFSVRIFRSFVLFIVFISLSHALFSIYSEDKAAREDLVARGRTLCAILAYNARTGLFAKSRDLLRDPVESIINQESVQEVAVYSADKKILLMERKNPAGGSGPVTAPSTFINPAYDGRMNVTEGEDSLEILSPVVLETFADRGTAFYFDSSPVKSRNVIGYVKVMLDKAALREEVKFILARSAAIAVIFLLAGSVFIFMMVRKLMSPLVSLTEAVRMVGMGESVEKLPVESSDEVGRLAVAFNNMSDNLRCREEEKRMLEEKLRHAQKMEAVGTLARGVAHDFNNILSTVQGSLYIIRKKLYGQSAVSVYTDHISNSLAKAKHLINSLLAFSKSYRSHPSQVDINRLITKMRPLLSSILGSGIELRLLLSEERLILWADSLQMEQVLLNLCTNARDALCGSGVVSVDTAAAIAGPEKVDSRNVLSGRYCLIRFSDNGTGMDDETRQRIFEPFFTTKEVGKGTGLGLSIVYGIVEQHKGIIEVSTEKGEGTVFSIFLPLFIPGSGEGP